MVEKDLTYHYGQVLVHIKGGVIPMNRPYLNTNTVKLLFCFCNLGGYGRIKFFFFFLNLPLQNIRFLHLLLTNHYSSSLSHYSFRSLSKVT